MSYPTRISSLVVGDVGASPKRIDKTNPATGVHLAEVECATDDCVFRAIQTASNSEWYAVPLQERARILESAARLLLEKKEEISKFLALETGRSIQSALHEVAAASACGIYLAQERQFLEDEHIQSAVPNRHLTLRKVPLGVGALITPFNNPLAGVAWKLFPALLCGNAALVKAHELSPYTPHILAGALFSAGVPKSAVSVLEGGESVGKALITDSRISFVSFTGSSSVAAEILKTTAQRVLRVSIESGGKNPFVVCDDADLERATELAVRSAFIDAGQRCAAASRIIVLASVYDDFKKLFLRKIAALKVGVDDTDDYGAIISEGRLVMIIAAIEKAQKDGATLLLGGHRINRPGYFLEPTVFENASSDSFLSQHEIFGPVVSLYKVRTLDEAIHLANNSQYFLTSAIHTRDMNHAEEFSRRYRGGVVRVNGPTYGSEPHVPFGGEGLSGNGWREPGTASFNFYSNLKQVSTDS